MTVFLLLLLLSLLLLLLLLFTSIRILCMTQTNFRQSIGKCDFWHIIFFPRSFAFSLLFFDFASFFVVVAVSVFLHLFNHDFTLSYLLRCFFLLHSIVMLAIIFTYIFLVTSYSPYTHYYSPYGVWAAAVVPFFILSFFLLLSISILNITYTTNILWFWCKIYQNMKISEKKSNNKKTEWSVCIRHFHNKYIYRVYCCIEKWNDYNFIMKLNEILVF